MKALIKEQILNKEGLSTLFCKVEVIVNGRPLTKLSDDPHDAAPLTSNHLLLLHQGTTTPPDLFQRNEVYARCRWRRVQYLSDVFGYGGQECTTNTAKMTDMEERKQKLQSR